MPRLLSTTCNAPNFSCPHRRATHSFPSDLRAHRHKSERLSSDIGPQVLHGISQQGNFGVPSTTTIGELPRRGSILNSQAQKKPSGVLGDEPSIGGASPCAHAIKSRSAVFIALWRLAAGSVPDESRLGRIRPVHDTSPASFEPTPRTWQPLFLPRMVGTPAAAPCERLGAPGIAKSPPARVASRPLSTMSGLRSRTANQRAKLDPSTVLISALFSGASLRDNKRPPPCSSMPAANCPFETLRTVNVQRFARCRSWQPVV